MHRRVSFIFYCDKRFKLLKISSYLTLYYWNWEDKLTKNKPICVIRMCDTTVVFNRNLVAEWRFNKFKQNIYPYCNKFRVKKYLSNKFYEPKQTKSIYSIWMHLKLSIIWLICSKKSLNKMKNIIDTHYPDQKYSVNFFKNTSIRKNVLFLKITLQN